MIKKIMIVMLVAAVCVGCSRRMSPVSPSQSTDLLPGFQPGHSNHALWGWADITIDPETREVNLVPQRSPLLHLNVLNPIMAQMGMDLDYLPAESDPPNGLFTFDITLTHPFPGMDKFSGFDVKGILITPGTFSVGDVILAGPDETQLINRDGLTRWWNPTEFTGGGLLGYSPGTPGSQDTANLTATVNPYKAFADSLQVTSAINYLLYPDLDEDTGRAVFSAGASNTRRYEIQFGGGAVFNYAIDASWDFPDPNPPVEVPDDFPIEANQPEPCYVRASPGHSLKYLSGGGLGGQLHLEVSVSDWQGLKDGNTLDEITSVQVIAPTLLTINVPLPHVYTTFNYEFFDMNLTPWLDYSAPSGRHMLVVRVESADGSFYSQGGGTVGPDEPLCIWQTFIVDVPVVECLPDDNNIFEEAEFIPISEDKQGTLCRPGGDLIDYADYFEIETITGVLTGTIDLDCNPEPTVISLFDASYTKLTDEYVSNGAASIDLAPFHIVGGTYYVRVLTHNEIEMVSYTLAHNGEPDPCIDPISFTNEVQVDTESVYKKFGRRALATDGETIWAVFEQETTEEFVYCRASDDGGLTFDPVVVVNDSESSNIRGYPVIACDPVNDILYCGWLDNRSPPMAPYVSWSIDGGSTWSDDVNIYDFEVAVIPDYPTPTGLQLHVDGTGRVHAIWCDRRYTDAHVFYSYSDDQGVTWHPAEQVDDSSYQGGGWMANVDAAVGDDGNVYVVWTDWRHMYDPPPSSIDVFFDMRTPGTPFGTDLMVHTQQDDVPQSAPAVDVGPYGVIHVVWKDRRNDGAYGGGNPVNTYEVWYARSEDGGSSFINEQEIPTPAGYTNHSGIYPKLEVSEWGSPYIIYFWGPDYLYLSRTCNSGLTWQDPVMVFEKTSEFYFFESLSLQLMPDGSVVTMHIDTRLDPGGDYTSNNIWVRSSG